MSRTDYLGIDSQRKSDTDVNLNLYHSPSARRISYVPQSIQSDW